MTPTLHGIANCDTVRRARRWLDERGVAYRFHDYRRDGVPEPALREWVAALGWEALLNRGGTTFRQLPEPERTGLDADRAIAIMLAHPAAIRRPVLTDGGAAIVGFDPARYTAHFATR